MIDGRHYVWQKAQTACNVYHTKFFDNNYNHIYNNNYKHLTLTPTGAEWDLNAKANGASPGGNHQS